MSLKAGYSHMRGVGPIAINFTNCNKPVLVAVLTGALLTAQSSPTFNAYNKAKDMIIEAINQANSGTAITAIPEEYLRKFDTIGLNLQEDETIEFGPVAINGKKATYTQQIRKKLLQASSLPAVFSQNVTLRGKIDDINVKEMTFAFSPLGGNQIISAMPDYIFDKLHKELAFCKHGGYVVITGEARYRDTNIDTITNIISVEELDDLDIFVQLESLIVLKSGWLDGEHGFPLDKQLAYWFEQRFSQFFPDDRPNHPYLSPRPDGGLAVEWQTNNRAISFSLTPNTHSVDVFFVDIVSGEEKILESVDLDTLQGWQSFISLLDKDGVENG
ncbi:MAG: hypothetical protein IJU76_07425 [Desulfovibrionaceae bacterium]|nr:hypothetical protein [Desulfovibrionaceae bacterium]